MGKESDVSETILDVSGQWADAEWHGDAGVLGKLLTDDFVGVGPRGFTLTKQAWIDRHASGNLRHDTFTWGDVQVRTYGDAAVVIGMTASTGSWAGQPVTGKSRVTQVLVRADESWAIAGIHLSQVSGPAAGPVTPTFIGKWLWRSFRDAVSRRAGTRWRSRLARLTSSYPALPFSGAR